MKVGIIGSGGVAQTLATKLLEAGHAVTISSRDVHQAKDRGAMGVTAAAEDWAGEQRAKGRKAAAGGFSEAAAFGEILINATAGTASLAALQAAGAENLAGKILVDVSNPLDFSRGTPPTLAVCNTDSIGEQIQAAFPEAHVVKALNTVNASVMVDPGRLGEETDLFVAGNDAGAKQWVTQHLLREALGWNRVIDLGDITAARAAEMYLPLWLRFLRALGTATLNVRVVVAQT